MTMADNYLEKRYEEVFRSGGGSASTGAHHPSLETLLGRVRGFDGEFEPGYPVHHLQLEAIVRAVEGLPEAAGMRFETSEASISVSSEKDAFCLGRVLQTMLLKAADLGLAGGITTDTDGGAVLAVGLRKR